MLIDIAQVVNSKGDGESSEVKVLEQCHDSLDKLDSGGTPRGKYLMMCACYS